MFMCPRGAFLPLQEPHHFAFKTCLWGLQVSQAVWEFMTHVDCPLRCRPTLLKHLAFMLCTQFFLPVRPPHGKDTESFPRPPQILPAKVRSLCKQSLAFLTIFRHLDCYDYAQQKLISSYKKTGAKSPSRPGFGPHHTFGISCRPTFHVFFFRDILEHVLSLDRTVPQRPNPDP